MCPICPDLIIFVSDLSHFPIFRYIGKSGLSRYQPNQTRCRTYLNKLGGGGRVGGCGYSEISRYRWLFQLQLHRRLSIAIAIASAIMSIAIPNASAIIKCNCNCISDYINCNCNCIGDYQLQLQLHQRLYQLQLQLHRRLSIAIAIASAIISIEIAIASAIMNWNSNCFRLWMIPTIEWFRLLNDSDYWMNPTIEWFRLLNDSDYWMISLLSIAICDVALFQGSTHRKLPSGPPLPCGWNLVQVNSNYH